MAYKSGKYEFGAPYYQSGIKTEKCSYDERDIERRNECKTTLCVAFDELNIDPCNITHEGGVLCA